MLAPAPEKKILRRMDYISDQKGILRRYLREKDGWNRHLEKAGSFINEILRNNEIRHVVVLGSGWLLDFPLEKILGRVEKITLVDVYFPTLVLRKVKDLKKVECVPADITGGYIQAIYKLIRVSGSGFLFPDDIQIPHILPEKGKLVLSLNILNQLDIILVDYVLRHVHCEKGQILNFRKALQEAHIKMLREHPFILISDYREILINTQGNVLEERELIFTGFPSGDKVQEWDWQFDTNQSYNDNANTKMKVRAVFSKGSVTEYDLP